MSQSPTYNETVSLGRRVLTLILLPVIIVVAILIGILFAILLTIGIVADAIQIAFFGTTGSIRWVGRRVEGLGNSVGSVMT